MKLRLKSILDGYVPEFPKQIDLKLPGMDLPKLQKVE